MPMSSSQRTARFSLLAVGVACALHSAAGAAANPANRGSRTAGPQGNFKLEVPAHRLDLILARQEPNSMTLSILAYEDLEGLVVYGPTSAAMDGKTPVQAFRAGVPTELVLAGLRPDSSYHYQLQSRTPGTGAFQNSPEYSFHTARPPGAAFNFTLTADVHLDEHTAPSVYLQSLANIRADRPDFHVRIAVDRADGVILQLQESIGGEPTRDARATAYEPNATLPPTAFNFTFPPDTTFIY